jgi:serine/threonine protein phosphatase 1
MERGSARVFMLRRRLAETIESGVRAPEGVRLYVVGDVHGCAHELDRLLRQIEEDLNDTGLQTHVIFLGDLVDRGPDSAAVVQRLLERRLPCDRHSFLMGNHEEAMIAVWNGDVDTAEGWLRYGGRETLMSYGMTERAIFMAGTDLPAQMKNLVPAEHIAFLSSFKDQIAMGDYLFVHAGVRPGVPLRDQDPYDLRWIRNPFLSDEDADHGAIVVHGHTISGQPEIRRNRIGIDTGCFQSGKLTALVLEASERRFLST